MVISQIFVNSLITGSIYALIASGFSLIYSTNRFLHLAHGATIIFCAYLFHFLFSSIGFFPALILTLGAGVILGYLMNKIIYQVLQRKKSSQVILLIASVAILLLIENVIQLLFGTSVKVSSVEGTLFTIASLDVSISLVQIGIIVFSLIVFGLLILLMNYSRLGLLFRAVSNNRELSSIHGINPEKISMYAMLLGSLLGSLAGILLGLEQALFPGMGTKLMIKGFTAAIIGSIYYIPGSIIGGYILGLIENTFAWFLPSGVKEALTFSLLFLFLLFRPEGIFSKFGGKRV